MRVTAEFLDGDCRVVLTPSDEWEKLLMGAITKGLETLTATVVYKPEGHFSNQRCHVLKILIAAPRPVQEQDVNDVQKTQA